MSVLIISFCSTTFVPCLFYVVSIHRQPAQSHQKNFPSAYLKQRHEKCDEQILVILWTSFMRLHIFVWARTKHFLGNLTANKNFLYKNRRKTQTRALSQSASVFLLLSLTSVLPGSSVLQCSCYPPDALRLSLSFPWPDCPTQPHTCSEVHLTCNSFHQQPLTICTGLSQFHVLLSPSYWFCLSDFSVAWLWIPVWSLLDLFACVGLPPGFDSCLQLNFTRFSSVICI